MIDTVVLEIPYKKGTITHPERFKPHIDIFRTAVAFKHKSSAFATQNPLKKDLALYGYMPRLTFYRRPNFRGNSSHIYFLKIEFSAPKILFKNNFDELEESDFDNLVLRLKLLLDIMGVSVSTSELRDAAVNAIHYSKNIVMMDGTSVTMVLNELAKADLNGCFGLTKTDFRTGHAVRYHSNSSDLIFYDKIEELRLAKISPKRTIAKDGGVQLSLFDPLTLLPHFSVLRMEYRLGNKRKIKQILHHHGFNSAFNFQTLFKKAISQKVLLSLWDKIDQTLYLLPRTIKSPLDVLNHIKQVDPNIKLDHALKMVGLLMLIENMGVVPFRAYFGLQGKIRSPPWYRLAKELKVFKVSSANAGYRASNHIPAALNAFKTVKLIDYNIQI